MLRRAAAFTLLLGWCLALIAARVLRSHTHAYIFLAWNLVLAVIPAVASAMLVRVHRAGRRAIALAPWFVMWLLFLPNAPYIVTDFVHLRPLPEIPLWFDVALLISCAGTGLLLGFTSVADVELVLVERYGRIAAALSVAAVLILSALGIYLGRFLRWNSWDPVADPVRIAQLLGTRALHPLEHRRTIAVTIVYGVSLALGYFAFRSAATPRVDR